MELFRDTHFDFMKYRKFWIIVSLAPGAGGALRDPSAPTR